MSPLHPLHQRAVIIGVMDIKEAFIVEDTLLNSESQHALTRNTALRCLGAFQMCNLPEEIQ